MQSKLVVMLYEQLNSVLGKIEESEESDRFIDSDH